jgi:hypothetical protein
MNKTWLWGTLGGALAATLLYASSIAAAPASGSTITVQTLTAKLMKSPSYLGATAAKLVRGDQLTFEGAKGDWYHAKAKAGADGWIHKSGVVEKAVALSSKPGGGAGGVTQDEVALAGRGFSKEVEAEYKNQHPDMDFSHVDKIEKLEVDSDALAKFAAEGKVGGAQ